ncbi:MAG: HDIG domain-containing protein [Chloroflexi bacterium]|nr:HDIG domain-containing protein [Chloroflexota bacterium]
MIAGDFSLERRGAISRWQFARALLISALLASALAVVFAFQSGQEAPTLVAGQVSSKTILAPDRKSYDSDVQTNEAREKAQATIADVYDPPNAEIAREQLRLASRVFDHMDSVRHDPYSNPEQKLEWVRSIPTVTVPAASITRTLTLDENNYHRVVTETLYVLEVTMRGEIRPNTLAAEYLRIPTRVNLAFSAEQADLVTQWARAFVVPNTFFNAQRTNELRSQAGARVTTIYRTIEKGEAIVREGEVITPLAIEALEELGILRPRAVTEDYAGPALLAVLLVLLLLAYLVRLRPALFARTRVLLLLVFLIVLFAIGAKLAVTDPMVLLYLYPVSASVMLLAVLVDSIVALGAALVLSLTVGFLAHNSLEITIYALVGSAIAALNLGRIERLPAILWTGVYIALANAAVVVIFRVLAHDAAPVMWAQQILAAIANGAVAGLIAIGSLFVLGKLFGITTSLELVDLARPTHPLLQKLLRDAPGTYHHSLVVSQLAEHAAQEVGADPLLVRVAAYYHDVGKTREPQMFIENQLEGVNIHDTLEPEQSATIVIDHVNRGLALAKQHRLPRRISDFIPQHHGTTLAAYFHRKAVQANAATPTDEKLYRYPGPKPQSREAGILMLADGVEATTRAEHPATPEGIRKVIDRIVGERLRDGQLDECDLTLRDIQRIKDAFFDVLQGLYHARVKYPEPPPPRLMDYNEPPEKMNAG